MPNFISALHYLSKEGSIVKGASLNPYMNYCLELLINFGNTIALVAFVEKTPISLVRDLEQRL